jgi:CheY-like chemotaxis protein
MLQGKTLTIQELKAAVMAVEESKGFVQYFTDHIERIKKLINLDYSGETPGNEAFEVLKQLTTQPDYIFLDINMPITSGKELLKELKRLKGLKNIPVVMWSTSSSPVDVEDCKKLGAIDFIVKPPEFKLLCEALKKFI